ncbi:MAG TPA: hypothetical protein VGL40_12415 [Bacillota bacterium]|jgi:hypothetical protein
MDWPVEPYVIPGERAAALMGSLALAWDGQWFLKAIEEFGLEAAMRLNSRVRVAFGRIEMRETLKALDKKRADDLADALRIVMTYGRLMMNDRLESTGSLAGDEAQIEVTRCYVAENAKRANLGRFDQACLACPELWQAWLGTLLPGRQVDIETLAQIGRGDGRCAMTVRIAPAGP